MFQHKILLCLTSNLALRPTHSILRVPQTPSMKLITVLTFPSYAEVNVLVKDG
jgi:hypothetical protein